MLKSNAKQLAALNKRRASRLKHELQRVGAVTKPAVVGKGKELSSGPYSESFLKGAAMIRGAGLYSVRKPSPPADPAILNKQSGRVYMGWAATSNVSRDLVLTITLTNSAPEFKYLMADGVQGARSRMMNRPLLVRLRKEEGPAFFARLRAANSRALKG